MLDILLSLFWDQLVIDQWWEQTVCVNYFNDFGLGSIVNLPVIKPDTLC